MRPLAALLDGLTPARVFGLALALRLAAAVVLPPHLLGPWDADSGSYVRLAREFIASGTFGTAPDLPTAQSPPGIVWMLAPLAALFDGEAGLVMSARIVHALLGALTALIIARLGDRLGGRRAAALAGVLTAVWPPLVLYCATLMSDTLFVFLQTAALFLLVRTAEHPAPARAVAAGAVAALAALTREPAIGLLPIGVLVLMFRLRRGARLRAVAPFALAFLVALAPWTARNFARFGQLAPVTVRGPQILYLSQHIPEDGRWRMDGELLTSEYNRLKADDQTPWIRIALREMLANPLHEPGPTLRMWGVKLAELWLHPSGFFQLRGRPILYGAYLVAHLGLLALSGWGARIALRSRSPAALFPLAAIAWTTVLHVFVVFPLARYFVPMLPFVALFAGVALARIPSKARPPHASGAPA